MNRLTSTSVLLLLMSGCVLAGPDYTPPEMVAPESFDGATSELFDDQSVRQAFWREFNDPALTSLVERGLQANTDILAALARLEESRALSGLSVYSLFPTVTASALAERSRQSESDPFSFEGLGVSEVRQLQFDSVWEIDLFGSLKRQNQRIVRRVEADEALLRDMQRSVIGEIAQSYFSLRGAQTQLSVQKNNVAAQSETVDILQKTLDAGRGTALDVARARALLRTLESEVPDIEAQVATARQRLAVLTADTTTNVDVALLQPSERPALVFPERIPLGSPEEWLKRRPDVQAAERQLAVATASVGVEAAEFYPKLTILGGFGYSGTSSGDIFDDDARRWNLGPSLDWRFLDIGRVRQRVQAAEALEREAVANFQGALLRALEDMENALTTYRTTTATALSLGEALTESTEATRLATLRFDNGASDYLEVLDARRSEFDIAARHARAATARSTALVAVYKALAAD